MKVFVIGNGGWGTALGMVLAKNGNQVTVWGPFEDELTSIRETGENSAYLPGVKIPPEIEWTSKAEAVADAEIVDEGGAGRVGVEVDAVMRPGSLVSGTVKFSDGQSLGWQLGASGQLGLIPDENNPEYRPKPEDIEEFQSQLQEVLQQKGF